MDAREKRLAQNQSVFRAVNERIEETAAAGEGADRHVYDFLCECSNADCNLLLPLTVSEYEGVRKNPTLFIVAPGHELPVPKRGEAAEFVIERDPRGGT